MQTKTFTPSGNDIQRDWWIIDAEGKTLGRLASRVAAILRGKHKPVFTPNLDMGDYVIIINADKIRVTGNRLDDKKYHRHSGYMGGLTTTTLREQLRGKFPERALETAIRGMLPKNVLGRETFRKLKVYNGSEHPHAGQQPKPLEF